MGVAELVAQAVGGDRDAFAALYDEFAPGINDFLQRMLGNPHDAADAVQETFITAGSRLHQLRDPSKFRAWLYAIARRQAYASTSTRSRRREREPALPEDELVIAATEVDPTDALADEELRSLLAAAADGLDERDQAVLHLHFRQGLGGDELALALGVERNNAHVLVHRVRERIQQSMGALLVARYGRSSCSTLDGILGGWDGTMSTVVRKRINRHAESCETCGATRANVMKPAALLGLAPLAPLPASAREAVLDRVELCSYDGEPWSGDDGFPPGDDRPVPPDPDGRGRAKRVLIAALVALVAFLVAGSVVLADADKVDRGVPGPTTSSSEEEGSSTTRRAGTGTTSSTTVPGTTTTLEPDTSPPTTRRSTTPTTRRPSTTPTTRRPSTTPTTAPPGTDPPTTAPPTTAPPSTTSTTRRTPPTTTPPTRPPTTRPPTTLPPPTTTTTQGTQPTIIG